VTVKKDMDRKISTDRKNDKVILVIEDNENFAKYLKEINDGMDLTPLSQAAERKAWRQPKTPGWTEFCWTLCFLI